jgi:signal transduction histidine kinase
MKEAATSPPVLPVSWQKGELLTVGIIIATCTWLGLWTALQYPVSLRSITYGLITSNAIGLTIWLIATVVRMFFRGRLPAWGIAAAIPTGFFLGSWLASLTGAPDFAMMLMRDPVAMRHVILSQIMIGIVITAFFLYFSHTKGVKEALERERRRAAEALQAETLARLSLLQAQIEPHFLFNTLANIHSLIKQDPESASVVLEELNAYLRTSLRRTREPTSTVGEELQLIETLLGIAAVRLGARLDYSISVPPELRSAPLPPLLLQPLVENAVRHGIEPAIEGGRIRVEVCRKDDALELSVHDTGVGLNAEAPRGVGLANVRARLASLYGARGKLEFYSNTPRGVIARLIVPLPAAGALT